MNAFDLVKMQPHKATVCLQYPNDLLERTTLDQSWWILFFPYQGTSKAGTIPE
jgi:hypothetical protein